MLDLSGIESVEPVVAVGLEHGAAEGADDGAPGAPVHGEQVADPGGGLHVRHAGAPAAARADPRRWLAAPHLPPLVHQEAEEHHRSLARTLLRLATLAGSRDLQQPLFDQPLLACCAARMRLCVCIYSGSQPAGGSNADAA